MKILKYNNQAEARGAGVYRFRFYRMGEWMDVIIDDYLPKKQHAVVKNNEYWVPLVEKAYAKFFGSYKMLIGGNCSYIFFIRPIFLILTVLHKFQNQS